MDIGGRGSSGSSGQWQGWWWRRERVLVHACVCVRVWTCMRAGVFVFVCVSFSSCRRCCSTSPRARNSLNWFLAIACLRRCTGSPMACQPSSSRRHGVLAGLLRLWNRVGGPASLLESRSAKGQVKDQIVCYSICYPWFTHLLSTCYLVCFHHFWGHFLHMFPP